MPDTNYSGLSQRTALHAAAGMLRHAEPQLVLSKYGLAKELPKNKADTVKFRRPIPFASVHATPLTEGVTPTTQAMVYEDVSATILQYGAVVKITDKVSDLAEDPVMQDATELCGYQAGETIERVVWGKIIGGTNVFYSNGSARNTTNTVVTLAMQRKITRYLKAQKGRKITSMMSSSVKYGTVAVDAAYIALGHTDLENDIRDMPGFTPTEKYGSMQAMPFEIGKVEDVRYVLTPTLVPFLAAGSATLNGMVSVAGVNTDVYPLIYISKDAYGLVPLKGMSAIKPSLVQPGTVSAADPLGQNGYVGWKTWFTALILNQTWLVRAEVCAKAL